MRERLIELIKASLFRHIDKSCCLAENVADDLLATGVIVCDTCAIKMENRPLVTQCLGRPLDEIIELVEAKDEGRIIVTPCKVGATVFIIDDYDCDPYVIAVKVDGIKSDRLGEWIVLRYPLGIKYNPCLPVEDVGKTIFLTKEEAEEALERMKGEQQ